MEIRNRESKDLERLETIARLVHSSDGYPPYMPDDDFAGFLDSTESIAAWVATTGTTIVGQVALHSGSSTEVVVLATDHLGVRPEKLGVVARLLVNPSHRREGVAQALLNAAERHARERGLVPILDVVDRFTPAIALYEREGWKRLGTVTVNLPDGTTMNEHVYTRPGR